MRIKEYYMEKEEKLMKAKGQEKVLLHEELLGREYNNRKRCKR